MQTVTELKTEDVNALHASFTVVFITQQIVVVHPGSGSSVREWQLVLGKAFRTFVGRLRIRLIVDSRLVPNG